VNPTGLEARVAVAEARIKDVDDEVGRVRIRLHEMETERATVALLAEQIKRQQRDLESVREELRAMKRAFYAFALSVTGSAVVFAFTILGGGL
jgi:septal ring factor EnvC (AmiA/AmiB activator)